MASIYQAEIELPEGRALVYANLGVRSQQLVMVIEAQGARFEMAKALCATMSAGPDNHRRELEGTHHE